MKIPIDTNDIIWFIHFIYFLHPATIWDELLLSIIKYKSGNRPYLLSVFCVNWQLQFQEVLFFVILDSHFIKHPEGSWPWITDARSVTLTFTLYTVVQRSLTPLWDSPSSPTLLLLSLAPVVLLCITEWITARNRGCLRQTLPKMSIGDLPASPQARAGWADGVWASQAAGHSRLEGQRLHGTGGVRAVVVLLWGQEWLRGVASRWGWVSASIAPPLARDPLLGLPGGLAPPRGLWAALLVLVFADGGVCATYERGVGDVRTRAGWGLW